MGRIWFFCGYLWVQCGILTMGPGKFGHELHIGIMLVECGESMGLMLILWELRFGAHVGYPHGTQVNLAIGSLLVSCGLSNWAAYRSVMVPKSCWILYGQHVGVLWSPGIIGNGMHVGPRWVKCGIIMKLIWVFCGLLYGPSVGISLGPSEIWSRSPNWSYTGCQRLNIRKIWEP